ncbi:MAG: tRNA threonylcarbamoyladenosine dehydratase [Pseudomonadota bacterium]|jgi:tRNA A37 threonylcarbamoyladenosine dehydratase|uniref:tRNA threonylcarbamoyladenosine dehydratase n=2 Tax=Methylophaga TaxID=40222 RepID=A0ABN0T794_9GAMM|nr:MULTISPECIES: tRNA threonylcarbamoyladenosine dehydratase [Methylophaga]MEC9412057.1 tRNA threonylcarbamoyladenosine dehydratase [Pseudomonadota bacterium]WVI86197.1 tRNA threonylcarbamoyladenosine dehydratase [Methylophaga thalassica]BDZ73025.1 tRNA cyclic N6-threonylcarbamoyladenosine(37) synthase TcdA [Methylophaga marina]GLP98366.1 tRNA cyclic N6-threonylcarbamoyladenosine(37) synthase TcdA [Methylophaga thalassica]
MAHSNPLFERTHILIGDEGIEKLQNSHIFLAGIGGVGSYTAEALARMGVGKMTLVDHDVVSGSNMNRQLVALRSTVDVLKADVIADRIKDINPDCQVTLITDFLTPESIPTVLSQGYDVVIDAIDSLSSKAALLETAWRNEMTVFASMGAGGKLDPTQVKTGDLMDTSICKLAKHLRGQLRKRGVGRGIQTVYSLEAPLPPLPPEPVSRGRARAVNGTVSYMPSIFGLTLAGLVINHIIGDSRRV